MRGVLSLLAVAGLLLAGCSTMEGFGKDVEKGGQSMQHSSSSTVQGLGKDVERGGEAIQEKAHQ